MTRKRMVVMMKTLMVIAKMMMLTIARTVCIASGLNVDYGDDNDEDLLASRLN